MLDAREEKMPLRCRSSCGTGWGLP
jgi:hypothetical protein